MELDLGLIQSEIIAGLPERARWMIREEPLDYDFSDSRRGLRRPTADHVTGEIEKEWLDLLIFGRSAYSEGGATPWIAVRQTDGAICGFDPERKEAIFLFNSLIGRFIDTFTLLGQYLERGQRPPSDIEECARRIDPEAYPQSEWKSLIDYVLS
jgi:hypothetical protein